MDVQSIYAVRSLPRPSLSEDIVSVIAKLKISFQPPFRRAPPQHTRRKEPDNWRETALTDFVRNVRVKDDDEDYGEIVANINKLSKENYTRLMTDFLGRLKKRDALFRLRITTLLFDCGIKHIFFAPIMADAYAEIVKTEPDALQDLATQTSVFAKLYNVENVTIVPSSASAGYEQAILDWSKQKEVKRGFAVYVSELYTRGLVSQYTMMGFVRQVMKELYESIRIAKTEANEEHVDALVRFLFAVSTKVDLKSLLSPILMLPKAETPSLNMKSRFKLEDAMKASR